MQTSEKQEALKESEPPRRLLGQPPLVPNICEAVRLDVRLIDELPPRSIARRLQSAWERLGFEAGRRHIEPDRVTELVPPGRVGVVR